MTEEKAKYIFEPIYSGNLAQSNMYKEVGKRLTEWCELNGYYSGVVVKLKIGDYVSIYYADLDGNDTSFCFIDDWWEGEEIVQILGIKYLDDCFD